MTTDQFWDIIAKVHRKSDGDFDAKCACSAAETTPETKPLFAAAVTCFMGKIDSRSSCSSVMTKVPEPDPKSRWSSGMTCGWATQVSELHWDFLGSDVVAALLPHFALAAASP